MTFLTIVGGVTLATVAFFWCFQKLVRLWLQSGNDAVTGTLQTAYQAYVLSITGMLIVALWPGISHWLTAAWNTLT